MRASVNDWAKINSYQQAKDRYESIKPKRFRAANVTDYTDCRPLGKRRAFWKYITKGTEATKTGIQNEQTKPPRTYYDCIFYRTPLLRFYDDGEIVVCPEGVSQSYHTLSSAAFLHACLPYDFYCWREAGRMVVVANDQNQRTKFRIPLEKQHALRLDVENKTVTNPQTAYRLVYNRKVTKLHREDIEPLIKDAFALAVIMDGVEVNGHETWDQGADGYRFESAAGILDWMKLQFSYTDWGAIGSGGRKLYTRKFTVPTRTAFNDKFYPVYYHFKEHHPKRDPINDPSVFELSEYGESRFLRSSPQWYRLHSRDPRWETHPNIL